jgi:hypothetical protein
MMRTGPRHYVRPCVCLTRQFRVLICRQNPQGGGRAGGGQQGGDGQGGASRGGGRPVWLPPSFPIRSIHSHCVPTGDFTVAFGHGHPLVLLMTKSSLGVFNGNALVCISKVGNQQTVPMVRLHISVLKEFLYDQSITFQIQERQEQAVY